MTDWVAGAHAAIAVAVAVSVAGDDALIYQCYMFIYIHICMFKLYKIYT